MHKGYQPHKEAVTEMDNKGRVSPTPEKMYVRNPNPRPIDGILIHKLPVEESKSLEEKMSRGAFSCLFAKRWRLKYRTTQCHTR